MAKNSGHIRNAGAVSENSSDYSVSVQNANGFVQSLQEIDDANAKIAQIINDIITIGHPTDGKPFKVGSLSSDIIAKYEEKIGLRVVNSDLYMSAGSMTHHQTGVKAQRGKAVPITDFASFASAIGNMDVYRNRDVIIFTDYTNKYIVHVNRSIKIDKMQTKVCCHISSSKVIDVNEFTRYDPIYKNEI